MMEQIINILLLGFVSFENTSKHLKHVIHLWEYNGVIKITNALKPYELFKTNHIDFYYVNLFGLYLIWTSFFIYHLIRRSPFMCYWIISHLFCNLFYPFKWFRKQICNTFYKENTIYDFPLMLMSFPLGFFWCNYQFALWHFPVT